MWPGWNAGSFPNRISSDLFLAEVVAAQADERVFSQNKDGQFRWHFEGRDELRTLHHIAGGQFFVAGDSLQVILPDPTPVNPTLANPTL